MFLAHEPYTHLYILNNGAKLRRAFRPLFQQIHGTVEILHILSVHPQKRSELCQDVPDTRR